MNKELAEMREMELKLLVIEFNKATQLDRSFSKTKLTNKNKKLFREKLLESCLELMNKIDNETLTNEMIRGKIRKLKNIDKNISFGQAQKVINVSLKQYCFITKAKEKILCELDCPLDSTTMKGYGISNNNMKNVCEKNYLEYQKKFEDEFGMRILKDREYGIMRMGNFFSKD